MWMECMRVVLRYRASRLFIVFSFAPVSPSTKAHKQMCSHLSHLTVAPRVDKGSAGQGQGCGRARRLLRWMGPLVLLLVLRVLLLMLLMLLRLVMVLLLLLLLLRVLPPEGRGGHDDAGCGAGMYQYNLLSLSKPARRLAPPPVCLCVRSFVVVSNQ